MSLIRECIKSIEIQYYQGDGDPFNARFTVHLTVNYLITHDNINFLPAEEECRKYAEKILKSSPIWLYSFGMFDFEVERTRMEELLEKRVDPDESFQAMGFIENHIDITDKVIDKLEKLEQCIL